LNFFNKIKTFCNRINPAYKYALWGILIVPLFGRVALHGSGVEDKLHRYIVPAMVGSIGGFLLGRSKDKLLRTLSEKSKYLNEKTENENKYKYLFDNSHDLIQAINPDGTIQYVNKSWQERLQYSDEEIKELNFFKIVHPDYRIVCQKTLDKLTYHQQIDPIEIKLMTKEGKATILEGVPDGIYKDGKLAGIRTIFRDITDKKREEALRESLFNIANAINTSDQTEFYQIIQSEISKLINTENIFIGIYDKHSDSIELPLMKDDKDNYDKVPAEGTISKLVIQHSKSMLLYEKDIDQLEKEGKIAMVGSPSKVWLGVPLRSEKETFGIVVVQNYNQENALNEDDLRLLDFVSHQIAISIQKKYAEEEIRKLSRSVEQSPASIILTDVNGNIEYVNPKFEEVTGYTAEEVKGKNPRILNSGNTEPAVFQELWQTITTGNKWQGEIQNRKKNNELFWEFVSISPVKDDKGIITHYLAIKEDITESKKLQSQIIQSQKMDSIGNLAGGIAHDFNNLLTAISGYAELALLKSNQNKPIEKELKAVLQSGERASNLTRQLLAFSRKQLIEPKILNLNDLIKELDKLLHRLISEEIVINLELDDSIPNIKADPGQIEQILMNLLINARDAIEMKTDYQTEKRITIETKIIYLDNSYVSKHSGSAEGNHVQIIVSDNGSGMSEEVKNRVFEPFYTTKAKGRGTGLGLATVYGIVKQNKGTIYIYSEEGSGTTFKINWPVYDDNSPVAQKNKMTQEFLRGNETILLVEDDTNVREFAYNSLKELGYNVISAENGVHGLQIVHEQNLYEKIDILVTDLIMPKMNGKQLAQKLKKIIPDILILYTSGYTDNYIVKNSMLEKGLNFLHKPYSIVDLSNKLREILNKD